LLSTLTSNKVKWHWTDQHQQAFEDIKRTLSSDVLLAYPDFGAPVQINTDASGYQLGAVIRQGNKPIAFYSCKLTPAQQCYDVRECELLSIIETLKEFCSILLGQCITVYTDHKNLIYDRISSDRAMRWHLLLEEYGAELQHLEGKCNVAADTLSRLDFEDDAVPDPPSFEAMAEAFAMDSSNPPPAKFCKLTSFPSTPFR
jgi:hypothetical protein